VTGWEVRLIGLGLLRLGDDSTEGQLTEKARGQTLTISMNYLPYLVCKITEISTIKSRSAGQTCIRVRLYFTVFQ